MKYCWYFSAGFLKLLPFLVLVAQLSNAAAPLQQQSTDAAGETGIQDIINGEISGKGAQPWIVALVAKADLDVSTHLLQTCTGALIDPEWVLTAAHCVDGGDPGSFELIIGRDNLDDKGGEVHAAAEIVSHPFFDAQLIRNDIALIRLSEPSRNTPIARGQWSPGTGSQATAYGWGFTEQYDETCNLQSDDESVDLDNFFCATGVFSFDNLPADLMQTEIDVFPPDECLSRIDEYVTDQGLEDDADYYADLVSDSVLCAWDLDGTSATCKGDSGGPLVQLVDGHPVLIGVTSFGISSRCLVDKNVEFYTSADYYEDFILDVLGRSESLDFSGYCPPRMAMSYDITDFSALQKRVTLSWDKVANADYYVLRYGHYPEVNGIIGAVKLPASKEKVSVKLNNGDNYFVTIQAFNGKCNGAMSPVVAIRTSGS